MNPQCPQCQSPLKSGAQFCGKCGAKVVTPSSNAATPRANPAPQPPKPVSAPPPQATPAQTTANPVTPKASAKKPITAIEKTFLTFIALAVLVAIGVIINDALRSHAYTIASTPQPSYVAPPPAATSPPASQSSVPSVIGVFFTKNDPKDPMSWWTEKFFADGHMEGIWYHDPRHKLTLTYTQQGQNVVTKHLVLGDVYVDTYILSSDGRTLTGTGGASGETGVRIQ